MRHARHHRSLDDRVLSGPHARATAVGLAVLLTVAGLVCCVGGLTLPAPVLLRLGLGAAGLWGVVVGLAAALGHLRQRPQT